jgi:HD superfamily phosphodiesterase
VDNIDKEMYIHLLGGHMKEVFNKIWELALPYQDKRDDPGHAEVTLRYATELVAIEKGNEDVVIPAIMLHDVGYSQLTKARRLTVFSMGARDEDRRAVVFEHQIESIKLAAKILRKVNYPEDLTDEILEIISQHDTREGFISKNEGLVRDADKLWRTSKTGAAAAEARAKASEGERYKKTEEGIKKPNYFYSETAKQMALADLKNRMQEGKNTGLEVEKTIPVSDEFMQQMISQSKEYSIVILKRTQQRDEPDVEKIMWEHGRRNFTLRANGLLPIVCPVSDGSEISGVSVFSASVEETKKMMDEDPGVKAGVFSFEVHPCRSFPGSCLPAN